MTSKTLRFLILILLLAFGLRLAGLDSQSLWWDELKTIQRAAMSFPELMADLAGHRAHLPLYFGLMQLWHPLGTSAFIVRYFSVIWGVVGVTAVFKLGQNVASNQVGLLAALLLAISPFHIWYSQEARMYSLLPTLLILAHWMLVANLKKNKTHLWLAYVLLMVAAVATHYFALFVVMAHYIFFVLHFRRLRTHTIRWLWAMLLMALLLLPLGWFVLSSRQGDNLATVPPWIISIHWYDPLLTVWNFALGPGIGSEQWFGYLAVLLFTVGFIVATRMVRLPKIANLEERPFPPKTFYARLLLLWFSLPLSLTFLISLNWPFLPDNPFSLYLDRYLIISLPPFLLLVAWGIDVLATKSAKTSIGIGATRFAALSVARIWLRPFFILIAVGLSSLSIWQLHHNPNHFRSDWRAALQLIDEEQLGTIVVLGQQDIALPVDYYGSARITTVQLPPPDNETFSNAYVASMKQQVETAVQQSPIAWHIEPFYNHDTHQFPESRRQQMADESQSLAQTWLKTNFTVLAQHQLPGLRLTLYDLTDD